MSDNKPQIDANDLQAVVQIIDICSRRGAFEGAELQGVGALRAKLVNILQPEGEQQTEETGE